MKYVLYFIFFLSFESHGYILNKTTLGDNIKWPSHISRVDFYLDSQNNNSLNIQSVDSIVAASLNQWDPNFILDLRLFSSSGHISGRNDIYFASKDSFFNDPGVIGVTQLVFDVNSGSIIETDIILNDLSFNLSTVQGSDYYIGDILSHEIGHALGLSHGQVFGSTMFYRLRNGQATIEQDDISGLKTLYNSNDEGSIVGNIIGGAGQEKIFGVRVSAISENLGIVMSSTVSNEDGSFSIKGLPLNDTYFLYIHPLEALTTVPDYFSERKTDYCQSGANFRGSFFQGCNARDSGFPLGISLSSTNSYDVGNVTIRCSFPVSNNYLVNKSGGTTDLKLDHIDGSTTNIGQAFTGYFSDSQIVNNTEDLFEIDLSHLNINALFSSGDYYLEFKTVSQKLFSEVKIALEVTRPDSSLYKVPTNDNAVYLDSELNTSIDLLLRVPISLTSSSLNKYTVKVTPYDVNSYALTSSLNITDIFPSSSDFLDKEAFYFMSVRVVKKEVDVNGNDIYSLVTHREYKNISDNSLCPDAPETYSLQAGGFAQRAAVKKTLKKRSDSEFPIACGSIDFPDDQNPSHLVASLLFSIIILTGLSQMSKFV